MSRTALPLFLKARISLQWLSELRRLNECFFDECILAFLLDKFPNYAWTAESTHFDFVGSRVNESLDVKCHLHFWQKDWGLVRATAVTRDGTGTE